MASRMETLNPRCGCIHASAAAAALCPGLPWIPTGGVEAKGRGIVETYLLQVTGNELQLTADDLHATGGEPGAMPGRSDREQASAGAMPGRPEREQPRVGAATGRPECQRPRPALHSGPAAETAAAGDAPRDDL
eukprot:364955-Chlamydomonas_euryale.AAC.18